MKGLRIESPVGVLTLLADDAALRGVYFAGQTTPNFEEGSTPILEKTKKQLGEYFAGKRQNFDLPLAPQGTDFQQSVWLALQGIGYGETVSYGEIANRIENPKAVRAVGLANGCNPISIVIPCHRVIGASGKLTGYGGGLERKEILLSLEQGGRLNF